MNKELKNAVEAADAKAQYDECAKRLLGLKSKQTTVIVDVEAQKKDPSEYKILNRAVFYVGRLLSSEKERDFTGSDYDAIKSVYSIWICMNKKENSITRFRFAGEDLVGTGRWKGNCGLMNIIMVGLAKELPPKGDEEYTLHRLLGTLFSEELTVVEKLNILEEEYDIPIEENLEKEVNYMCNLGEGIEERALERGITVGEAGGEAAIVKRMNKNGFTAEQIVTATDKDVEEVEAILAGGEPVLA